MLQRRRCSMNFNKNNISMYLYAGTMVFSIAAQIQEIQSIARVGMYAMWAVLFLHMLFVRKLKIEFGATGKFMIGGFVALFIFCLLMGLIQNTHLDSSYLAALPIPILVYFTAYNLKTQLGRKHICFLCRLYVACAVALGCILVVLYIPSYQSWLSANTYIVGQKNSASQIMISALLIAWFFIHEETSPRRMAYWISGMFFCVVTALFQSRAALLGLFTALLAYIFIYSKHKLRISVIVIALAAIAFSNDDISYFVQQSIGLNKYDMTDINSFSAGRIDNYTLAWRNFQQHPIVGTGSYKVDNLYICFLAELGIIGFACIMPLWFQRIGTAIRFLKDKDDSLKNVIVLLTIFYMVESIFERLPPFGPGVCSFFFWTLCGFADAEEEKLHVQSRRIICD